eukprot:164286-Rhodomonas_salina.5
MCALPRTMRRTAHPERAAVESCAECFKKVNGGVFLVGIFRRIDGGEFTFARCARHMTDAQAYPANCSQTARSLMTRFQVTHKRHVGAGCAPKHP